MPRPIYHHFGHGLAADVIGQALVPEGSFEDVAPLLEGDASQVGDGGRGFALGFAPRGESGESHARLCGSPTVVMVVGKTATAREFEELGIGGIAVLHASLPADDEGDEFAKIGHRN